MSQSLHIMSKSLHIMTQSLHTMNKLLPIMTKTNYLHAASRNRVQPLKDLEFLRRTTVTSPHHVDLIKYQLKPPRTYFTPICHRGAQERPSIGLPLCRETLHQHLRQPLSAVVVKKFILHVRGIEMQLNASITEESRIHYNFIETLST